MLHFSQRPTAGELSRDHILDLSHAAQHYAKFTTYQTFFDTRTNHYATQFAFGAAILWSPFYAISLALDHVAGLGWHARSAIDFISERTLTEVPAGRLDRWTLVLVGDWVGHRIGGHGTVAVDPPGDTDWPRSPIDASGWSAGRVRRGSGRPIRQRAVVLAILVWLSITVGGGDGSLLAADRVASSDVLSGQCFLVWSPITILALIGLVGLSIVGPRRTRILLGLFVIMDIAVNGVAGDPTGGASFGMRRMTAMFPILAIGLAWLLQRSMSLPRVLNRSLVVASLTGVGLTMWLFFTYIRALIDPATGTVLDAVAVWLPPHTTTTFDALRSIHLFGFGSY